MITSPRQVIAQIDRQISQIHFGLEMLERIEPFSAASWQAAWDKHPEMRAQEQALYYQRGIAQQARDEADHRAAMRDARQERRTLRRTLRRKTCPTCGSHAMAA